MPLFAARFPDEVAGMVLVDPVAPGEWNPPTEHDRRLTRIGAKVCRARSTPRALRSDSFSSLFF